MTPAQRRSAASRKAFRSRKRQDEALKVEAKRLPAYLQRVVDATTPDVSSAQIAERLGVTPEFVRKAWRRAGLPKRLSGFRPKAAVPA